MRKAALLAAVMLIAALPIKSNVAFAADDPNQNTYNFMRDAMNPYGATVQPSSNMHHMHHHHMHHHRMHHHRMHHHRMHHHHMHHMNHGKM